MPRTKAPTGKSKQSNAVNKVIDIIQFMGENQLAEIELETTDLKLNLKKRSQTVVTSQPADVMQSHISQATTAPITISRKSEKAEKSDEQKETAIKENNYHKLISPMAGNFYRAPSPTSPPFINEGDEVKTGQTVCIVEAMKMMNEIKADKDGKVVKILIENGEPIEKGAELFYIGD
ncbi:MAG: acetyl-CoA carboxylase biotin carboxyl carrier protein [Candidatus Rifleibacteriota bacterium]